MPTAPTVLVAHADDCVREFSALVLTRAGVRVAHAQDGLEALLKIAALRPDAVLAHWALPEVDGLVLRERIRTNPQTGAIPIVVVKGSPQAWLDATAIVGRFLRHRQTAKPGRHSWNSGTP